MGIRDILRIRNIANWLLNKRPLNSGTTTDQYQKHETRNG